MGQGVRPVGWERRLEAVLDDWRDRPHGWGSACIDFAADAVLAVSGRNLASELGLPLRGAREAAALYRRLGANTLDGAVTAVLGEPVPPLMARRGDVVEAMLDSALGVCLGDRAAFLGSRGLIELPLAAASRAWRV